jgi:hypothetical protein
MRRTGKRTADLGPAIYEVVWSAAALHVVTLLAVLAAAMLFGVEDLAAIGGIVRVLSVLIWGGALLVLLTGGVVALARTLGRAPADQLHDSWLDDGP